MACVSGDWKYRYTSKAPYLLGEFPCCAPESHTDLVSDAPDQAVGASEYAGDWNPP